MSKRETIIKTCNKTSGYTDKFKRGLTMKQKKLLVFLLILSLRICAQTTQGGPPNDDLRNSDIVNWQVDDKSILHTFQPKIKTLLPSLTSGLRHCVLRKKKNLQINNLSDFYKIYLGYNFIHILQNEENLKFCLNSENTKNNCQKPNDQKCKFEDIKRINCMKKRVDQEILDEIIASSSLKRFIMLELKVTNNEAEYLSKILEQFKSQ
jgi:hypothetical protein